MCIDMTPILSGRTTEIPFVFDWEGAADLFPEVTFEAPVHIEGKVTERAGCMLLTLKAKILSQVGSILTLKVKKLRLTNRRLMPKEAIQPLMVCIHILKVYILLLLVSQLTLKVRNQLLLEIILMLKEPLQRLLVTLLMLKVVFQSLQEVILMLKVVKLRL